MIYTSIELNLPENAFFPEATLCVKPSGCPVVRVGYEPDPVETNVREAMTHEGPNGVFSITTTAKFFFDKELFQFSKMVNRVDITEKAKTYGLVYLIFYRQKEIVA